MQNSISDTEQRIKNYISDCKSTKRLVESLSVEIKVMSQELSKIKGNMTIIQKKSV